MSRAVTQSSLSIAHWQKARPEFVKMPGNASVEVDLQGLTPVEAETVKAGIAAFPERRHTLFSVTRFIPNASAADVTAALAKADHIGEDTFHKAKDGKAVPALDVGRGLTVMLQHTNVPMLPDPRLSRVAGVVTRWDPDTSRVDGAGGHASLLEVHVAGGKTPTHAQHAHWHNAVKDGVKGVELTWEVDTQPFGELPPAIRKVLVWWVSHVMGRAVHNKLNLVEARMERNIGRALRSPSERAALNHLTSWFSWSKSRLEPTIQQGWSKSSAQAVIV